MQRFGRVCVWGGGLRQAYLLPVDPSARTDDALSNVSLLL